MHACDLQGRFPASQRGDPGLQEPRAAVAIRRGLLHAFCGQLHHALEDAPSARPSPRPWQGGGPEMTALDSHPGPADALGDRVPAPAVTVIVPTRNEQGNVAELLGRLVPALPAGSEVLFVD